MNVAKLFACALIVTLSAGCSTLRSMGVRPNAPGGAFSDDVLNKCERLHPTKDASYRECLEYQAVVEWGEGLYEAYKSRATLNEWFIYFAGTIALASLAATAGVAAAGHGGSEALKYIPIAGGFTSGFFALMDNKAKAAAYIDAANETLSALGEADKMIGASSDTRAYGPARAYLYDKIVKATNKLEESRYTLAAAAAERKAELEKLQGEVVKTKIDAGETQKVTVVTGATTTKAGDIITLTTSKIDLTAFKWPDDFKILVGGQEAKLISRSFDSVTFEASKLSPGAHTVELRLKDRAVPAGQPKAVILTY